MARSLGVLLGLTCLLLGNAHAYLPAWASNDTTASMARDSLRIDGMNGGAAAPYTDRIQRVLFATRGGISIPGYMAALLHFDANNASVPAPIAFVALISCDPGVGTNDTTSNALSSAGNMGASAVILYSETSATCVVSPQLIQTYNATTRAIDIYVTTTAMSASNIQGLFSQVAPDNYWFNISRLYSYAQSIRNQISQINAAAASSSAAASAASSTSATATGSASATTSPAVRRRQTQDTYLIATIENYGVDQSAGTTQAGGQTGGGGGANTGLAMIILYAITGCVTLLFLVVILSGAIRAMRHPERYGPRARNMNGPGDGGQTRARGLTKAMLDTIPVVKFFSSGNQESRDREAADQAAKDVESRGSLESRREEGASGAPTATTPNFETGASTVPMYPIGASTSASRDARPSSEASSLPRKSISIEHKEVRSREQTEDGDVTLIGARTDENANEGTGLAEHKPASIEGADPTDVNDSITCPICLLDFEDGDDIRILPCDSRHRFHDACVVPWLLNVSSLCPLCRLDLSKDNNASAEGEGAEGNENVGVESEVSRATALRNFFSPRNSRWTAPVPAASADANSDPTLGIHDPPLPAAEAETANAEAGTEGQGNTNSRFMRYVQQRRSRVRARGRTRGESVSVSQVVP